MKELAWQFIIYAIIPGAVACYIVWSIHEATLRSPQKEIYSVVD